MLPLERNKQAALRWVNEQRERMGRPTLAELASGACLDPGLCTLAQSLGTGWITAVSCKHAIWNSGEDNFGQVELPVNVTAFANAFDHHAYPELER